MLGWCIWVLSWVVYIYLCFKLVQEYLVPWVVIQMSL